MAVYDCGVSSVLLVSNHDAAAGQSFLLNGVQLYIEAHSTLVIPCSGQVELEPWGNIAANLIPGALSTFNDTFLLGLAGLLAGFLISWVITKTAL